MAPDRRKEDNAESYVEPTQSWISVEPEAFIFPLLLWLAARWPPPFAIAGAFIVSAVAMQRRRAPRRCGDTGPSRPPTGRVLSLLPDSGCRLSGENATKFTMLECHSRVRA